MQGEMNGKKICDIENVGAPKIHGVEGGGAECVKEDEKSQEQTDGIIQDLKTNHLEQHKWKYVGVGVLVLISSCSLSFYLLNYFLTLGIKDCN